MAPTGGPLPGWGPPPPPPPGRPPGPPTGPPAPHRSGPLAPLGPGPRRYAAGTVAAAGLAGAVVGIVAGFVLVFVAGVLIGSDARHPAVGTYGPRSASSEGPAVGDCLRARPSLADVTTDAEVVPCEVRHKAEVVGVTALPALDRRPRDRAVDRYVSEACSLAYRDYSGRDPDDRAGPDLGAVVPDADAWAAGDREVWCLVDSQSDGDGVGSIRRR